MKNKDLFDDQLDDQSSSDSDVSEQKYQGAINIDVRRRLEAYREQRELDKLLQDDFEYLYLDDIA